MIHTTHTLHSHDYEEIEMEQKCANEYHVDCDNCQSHDCHEKNNQNKHICHCMIHLTATHEHFDHLTTLLHIENIFPENINYNFNLQASVFRPPIV